MTIDFILDCINVICVFAVFVFIVGIVAGKDTKTRKYVGMILPILMVIATIVTTLWTLNLTYFILLAIPTAVLWFVYRVSRRAAIRNKNNPDIQDDLY